MIDLLRRLLGTPEPPTGARSIVCLGNPGARYSTTRHNVAWWLADRLSAEWSLGRFRERGPAAVAEGEGYGVPLRIVKPLIFVNRSGDALEPLLRTAWFQPAVHLMIVVDDVALEPGRVRMRVSGSAGGHNGLKSVEAALGSRDYPRLRIGVGSAPAGQDLAEWVLSSPPPEERRRIVETFPLLTEALRVWVEDGVDAAMRLANGSERDL